MDRTRIRSGPDDLTRHREIEHQLSVGRAGRDWNRNRLQVSTISRPGRVCYMRYLSSVLLILARRSGAIHWRGHPTGGFCGVPVESAAPLSIQVDPRALTGDRRLHIHRRRNR